MSVTIKQIKKAYDAAPQLRALDNKQLKKVLMMLADELEKQQSFILKANRADVEKQDPDNPRIDRLRLDEKRIKGIAGSIRKVSRLPNPVGKVLEKRKLKNGLLLEKVSVPLGVVGAIYESRPNVTFDIAALCIRSGNACVLKGSSEAENSNRAAVKIIHQVLKENGLSPAVVTLLSSDRETVQELFTATQYIDVLIPRGSDGLIQFVRQNSQVPVIETGAGVCHVYVQKKADLKKAVDITVNAKVSRPSVCNAMDALLIDQAIAPAFLRKLKPELEQYKVEIFADPVSHRMLKGYPYLRKAKKEDYGREFLALKCAVKVVNNSDEAIEHIRKYSTKHSEAIVTEDKKQAEHFLHEVDAAAVYHNASTRFTDGEEFGLGAEIGISTQKLHARGPFALEKLVTEKWVIRGQGQVR
ncbi:MAG: glutamate-5-semialdehyde dehydrogenase [Chitinophagaceae bacterium]|nr:glutamate-5-semialdehyde dehydrogenase [Chitinophagaceae bacterium]